MSYCSQCKRDIDSDAANCPDCGMPLVMGLAAESSVDEDDVDAVLLLRAENKLHADLLVSALEDQDIPCLVKGLGITDGLGGAGSGAVPYGVFSSPRAIEIYVSDHDFDRAKEVMDSLQGSELAENDELNDPSAQA
jgi:hypothetical protein